MTASSYNAEDPVDLHGPAPARSAAAAQPTAVPADRPGPEQLAVVQPPVTADPALWGWRARLRKATGGLIKPGPGKEEARHRQAEVAVRQYLGGGRLVMVANPKGGSQVSTTTLMLAHTFAALRGGPVVAWDNNEARGTLAQRAEVATPDTHVWHLLGAAEHLLAVGTAGDLTHYLRSQPSRAEVLASDTDPARAQQIGPGECGQIWLLLSRYFGLTVMDTGNNVRTGNWQWAAAIADQLVVPITLEPDHAQSAAWMLDHLDTRRPDLVSGAVTVVGPATASASPALRRQMLAYFAARTAQVVQVPFDPQLAGGRPIVRARISDASRRAWVGAAAAVADRLAARSAPRPDQLAPRTATSSPPAQQNPALEQPGHAQVSVTELPLRKAT
ncbi:MinD/ParA family protein [Lentzea sp. NPDC059081]|uniref:MinD/ParA family ATP-binding protein n=1 Tax=Lentzea sp. NPDC059081 TaxID=3346719 RepID=UPI0036A4FC14